jgi:zinc transporter ZupT
MMSIYLPILAVFLGFILAYFIKTKTKNIALLLAFSGGFLLSVTILELLPDIYKNGDSSLLGLCIIGGIILQISLEYLSGGAEHGHLHLDENKNQFPLLLFVSLCIHSLFEGFPTTEREHMLLGVVVHKIPIAFILSTFLLSSAISKIKILLFVVVFALMTPIGSLINMSLSDDMNNYKVYVDAVVVGILLHISSTILFESSKQHKFDYLKALSILAGIGLAVLLIYQH